MKAGSYSRHLLTGIPLLIAIALAAAGIWMWRQTAQSPQMPPPSAGERLPALGTVPHFSLTERSGRAVTLADLRDKVWVADFIYTTCTDTCPLQTARMAKMQQAFAREPDFRLVSISVDPTRDTVAVLGQYADRFAADRERWLFLTGSQTAIYALVRDGFKLDVEDVRKTMETHPEPAKRGKPGKPSAAAPNCGMENAECGMADRSGTAWLPDRVAQWLFAPATAFAHSNHSGSPVVHSSRFVLVDRRGEIRGYYLSDDDEAQGRLRADLTTLLREPR